MDRIEKTGARVAVHGSYFANNFGDTLLIKIMCDWVSEVVGSNNVYLAVPGKKEEQDAIGYQVVAPQDRRTITHLVFAGGGYLGEPLLPLAERYRWYFRNYARHLGWVNEFEAAKKAAFGIGVGPLSDPFFRYAVGKLFSQMEIVYARDQESMNFLHAYGFNTKAAHLGTDMAMSLEASHVAPQKPFAIHASGMSKKVFMEILASLGYQQAGAQTDNVDLLFDGLRSNKALRPYQQLCEEAHVQATVVPYGGVDDLLRQIAKYSLIFTSKLHVGITATALGRKVIAMPHHPKTMRFYRSLGLQQFCLEGDEQISTKIERLMDPALDYVFNRHLVNSRISDMRKQLRLFLVSDGQQVR